MRFYFEFHFDQDEGYLAHLHDPLAAACGAGSGAGDDVGPATVDVELTGTLTRGMTIADWSRTLGPRTQRAHRRRRRPCGLLRAVHRARRPFRPQPDLTQACSSATATAAIFQ